MTDFEGGHISSDGGLVLIKQDDATHGEQEQSAFNAYYHSSCYASLYIFCGRDLLVSCLRPSHVDPTSGVLAELQRIIPPLRQ